MPLIQLSGAIAPIESIPTVFRVLSFFDPLRHDVTIARSLILKGVDLQVYSPAQHGKAADGPRHQPFGAQLN